MTHAVELTICQLWTVQVTWRTGTVTRYPTRTAQAAATLQAILAADPKITDVRRYPSGMPGADPGSGSGGPGVGSRVRQPADHPGCPPGGAAGPPAGHRCGSSRTRPRPSSPSGSR
jgi:hypothetical protein